MFILFVSCTNRTPEDYITVSDELVDGYFIYEYEHKGLFCNTYYEDIYYSGEDYNYGFSFYGCSPEMTFFIVRQGEYLYLQYALDQGFITLESLKPLLEKLDRQPEEFSPNKADYYWLDFHINHEVVYAYAGGECNQGYSESFIINELEYTYSATGCMKEHILYLQRDGDYVPISDLILNEEVDGKYLIPLLDKVE
jgi:hypothetical protein